MVTTPIAAIGAWFLCHEMWNHDEALVRSCVAVFGSESWHAPLRHFSSQAIPGRRHPRKPGLIRKHEASGILTSLLTHEDLWEVTLSANTKHCSEYLSVGTHPEQPGMGVAIYGMRPLYPEGLHPPARWVDTIVGLGNAMRASSGIVAVMQPSEVTSEISLCGIVHDGVLQHPYPEQFKSMQRDRWLPAKRRIRFPRWGTLLSHEHIAALGGVEKIQQHVEPVLVAPCGEGYYFQLTDDVATSTSAEALAKQQKFIELVRPLLP